VNIIIITPCGVLNHRAATVVEAPHRGMSGQCRRRRPRLFMQTGIAPQSGCVTGRTAPSHRAIIVRTSVVKSVPAPSRRMLSVKSLLGTFRAAG
jgi:hypothetical protein